MYRCAFRRAARVCALAATPVVVTATASFAQTLPSPWTSRDIGSPALAGSATHNAGVFTIKAAGVDIWYAADQFHFVYQQISGDVDVSARVDSITAVDGWSKAGVMIRSALTPDAAHAFAVSSAQFGYRFQRRRQTGEWMVSGGADYVAPPRWVRLRRQGTQVTGYTSTDGVTWTVTGSDTIALGATAYVGLAVTSHNAGLRTTATVSSVSIVGTALPAGQQSLDIGGPAVRGSASYQQGTYTVNGGGADIWGVADQFHYVYLPVTGDIDARARVASLEYVDGWTKAGVMIRESLTAGSRHAFAAATPGSGYAFQRRPETGGYSEHTGASGAPPGWIRLVRKGSLFEAYRSADGSAWTAIGTDTIAMGTSAYVGLAVSGHSTTNAATAVIDNFSVVELAPSGNRAPSVTLTGPAGGTSYTAPATVTMTASAQDPEGRLGGVAFFADGVYLASDTTAPFSFTVGSVSAGTYALAAVAYDVEGTWTATEPVSIVVNPFVPAPRLVVFTASPDHATLVTSYTLKVFASDADTESATPVATSNLGKPAPASTGEITVDRSAFFTALPAGSYQAVVVAVSSSGDSASPPVMFTR